MIRQDRVLQTLLDLVRIDNPSWEESAVADYLEKALHDLGCAVTRDSAGNVIGSWPGSGEPLMLSAHMDSVMPCRGVLPAVRDDFVVAESETILGADDLAGVSDILEGLRSIQEDGVPHRTAEIVFTIAEEVGLEGAKALDYRLITARQCVVFDAEGRVGRVINAAPWGDTISASVHGRSAHAGASPEKGVSAIAIAARAVNGMSLGRLDAETTANVGTIQGGVATNIVPELVQLEAEARSRNPGKLELQTRLMVRALQQAADAMGGTVDVEVKRSYEGYALGEDAAIVRLVQDAAAGVGLSPFLEPAGGASDANVFNGHGIETVDVGIGVQGPHTHGERIAISELVQASRLAQALLTLP